MSRSDLTPKELKERKIISRNINRYAQLNDVTQTKISTDLNIPKSTLSGYFNATSTPSPGNVQKIADYFGLKKSDLDPRFEKPENIIDIKPTVNIPLISTVACGEPIFTEDNYDNVLPFPAEIMPKGKLFGVVCEGDSMSPTVEDGDYAIIRAQEVVENGEVACVVFDNDSECKATLKRIKKVNGVILLEPDNDKYESYLIQEDDEVRILGKMVISINVH